MQRRARYTDALLCTGQYLFYCLNQLSDLCVGQNLPFQGHLRYIFILIEGYLPTFRLKKLFLIRTLNHKLSFGMRKK